MKVWILFSDHSVHKYVSVYQGVFASLEAAAAHCKVDGYVPWKQDGSTREWIHKKEPPRWAEEQEVLQV